MEQFSVKTDIFEGPLDLLLNLIEKRKLFINDISLSQVADDYIAYVNSLEKFPLGDSANFILIASTLLLIKSKSLLPTLELTEEEQGSVSDLEHRLKEYQRYKVLSLHLKERFGQNMLFTKQGNRNIEPVFTPNQETTSANLHEAIRNILHSLPKLEKIPHAIVKKIMSLEEMIGNLTDRIRSGLKLSFKEFSKHGQVSNPSATGWAREERVNVIVGFLAMLELVKQGSIIVRQERLFADIEMENNNLSTPTYM